MTQDFQVPAGSRIQVGVPAQPFPESVLKRLTVQLRSVPGLVEAHLPLVHIPDAMPEPAQILIVVFDHNYDLRSALPIVAGIVGEAIPKGSHLDIWPLRSIDPLLGLVRKANCLLFDSPKSRPWWKLWSLPIR